MSSDSSGQVFPIRDMELLHHYTAYSFRIMTAEPEQFHIFQVEIPRLAFSNRFLLHGILSLTALHKRHWAQKSEETALTDIARYHQQHALTLYIPLLQTISEENCHALFCFSVILSAITFAMIEDDEGPSSLIFRFLDCIDTLMGCAALADEAKGWLLGGQFSFIIEAICCVPGNHHALADEPRQALGALLKIADRIFANPDPDESAQETAAKHAAYLTAIQGLACVMEPPPGKRQLGAVVSWPVMTGYEYIALVKRRDPLAMVILGHYGVALYLYAQEEWMFAGLGKRVAEAVAMEVDSSWRPHLAWAVARVAQPSTQPASPVRALK